MKQSLEFSALLFSAYILCSVPTFGQSGFGLNAGGSFSNFNYGEQVSSVDNFDNKNKEGLTGGLKLDFDLGDNEVLKISPELFIIQNGSNEYFTNQNIADLITRRVSLDYIGLYLPFTIYVPTEEGSDEYNGVMLKARLFSDFVINGEIKDGSNGTSDISFQNTLDKFDFGYSVEGGFLLQGFSIMVGYNWGLKNIEFNDSLGGTNSNNYLLNNKGLTLQVGYVAKLD